MYMKIFSCRDNSFYFLYIIHILKLIVLKFVSNYISFILFRMNVCIENIKQVALSFFRSLLVVSLNVEMGLCFYWVYVTSFDLWISSLHPDPRWSPPLGGCMMHDLGL